MSLFFVLGRSSLACVVHGHHLSWGDAQLLAVSSTLGGDVAGMLIGGGKVLIGQLDRPGCEAEATVGIKEGDWDKAAHCPLF